MAASHACMPHVNGMAEQRHSFLFGAHMHRQHVMCIKL